MIKLSITNVTSHPFEVKFQSHFLINITTVMKNGGLKFFQYTSPTAEMDIKGHLNLLGYQIES